jgi:RNA polymerase sigma-70 factor (ECF subfamily)
VQAVSASETELARRLMQGDASAFDEFVEVFRKKLFHFSLMTCGQPEDAEEVAQETLLKVFESFRQLRDPEHVRAWVFRIAKNVCFMKRRKSVFAPEQELSLDDLLPAWRDGDDGRKLEIADWSAIPEQLAIRGELSQMLARAIRNLPEIYRTVLLLRDVDELTTAETAGVLQVGEDVIKQRLHRARLAVRKKLDALLRTKGDVYDAGRMQGNIRAPL